MALLSDGTITDNSQETARYCIAAISSLVIASNETTTQSYNNSIPLIRTTYSSLPRGSVMLNKKRKNTSSYFHHPPFTVLFFPVLSTDLKSGLQPNSPLFCLHRLVLETLIPLPQDRKCFRMINGVLVERTVKDVKPALETNSEGLKKVLADLVKQYKRQQEEMEKWKVSMMLPIKFSPPSLF